MTGWSENELMPDLEFLRRPDVWPLGIVVAVEREDPEGIDNQVGTACSDIPGVVFLTNVHSVTATTAVERPFRLGDIEIQALEIVSNPVHRNDAVTRHLLSRARVIEYPDWETMLADGWRVD